MLGAVPPAAPSAADPSSAWRATVERLGSSRFNYWFGYAANLTVVALLMQRAHVGWSAADSAAGTAGWALAGLVLWTLAEYLLHRFVYHAWHSFLSVGHGIHHRSPRQLIGVPWYLTSLAAALLWAGLSQVGRQTPTAVCLAFAWLGYLGYCLSHHGSHHWAMRGRWLRARKRHHMLHHAHPGYNWGFTTSLWDRVFGTQWPPG